MPLYNPGSLSIDTPVGGGTANRVLFIGPTGLLDDDAALAFDVGSAVLTVGARVVTGEYRITNNGTAGAPSLVFSDSVTTGMFRPAANQLGLAIAGVHAWNLGGTGPDSDQTMAMGRALIDSRTTDRAQFSHRDQTATNTYALSQLATGETRVNATSGTHLRLRIGDLDLIDITNSAIGFYGTAAAAKPTVTGSRGGNAALASLLTGLAGLGLLTDSSTA